MKNRKRKRGRRPRSPGCSASRPSQPNRAHLAPARPYAAHEPAQRVAHACAPICLARSHCPLDPACQPHPPSTVSSSSPTPQPPMRPAPDSYGRGGPGGHARGMTLSPLRHAHATPHHRLMRCTRLHRTMPAAMGGMVLGYKASPHAAHARCLSLSLSLRRRLVARQPHRTESRGPRRRS